jgi:hypothetical protein
VHLGRGASRVGSRMRALTDLLAICHPQPSAEVTSSCCPDLSSPLLNRMVAVPDLRGKPLRPGDPVIYERPDATADTTATVLAVHTHGRYLIQLDPIRPRTRDEDPHLKAALDHEAGLLPQLAANPADLQEPFEVSGSCLYLLEPESGEGP